MANAQRQPTLFTALRHTSGRLALVAVDLLYPARCVGCNREGAFICEPCQETLPLLEPPFCLLCAKPARLMTGLCSECWARPLRIEGIRAPYSNCVESQEE